MTCIVGYVEKDTVWIGGDSAGTAGHYLQVRSDEKVFIKENMIFGFTSSFRMGQIIRSCFQIPEQSTKKTDYDYLCSDFIDALIKCFKDKNYCTTKDGEQQGGCFLLGYKGNLYRVESDFQVGKVFLNYNATGCGEHLALGAMYLLNHKNCPGTLTPEKKITLALEAASTFSGLVCEPFKILKLQHKTKESNE